MRPQSIVNFERLFLVSLAVSLLSFLLSYDALNAQLATDPALKQFGFGSGMVIGSMMLSMIIYLLLWFFIARKASNIAKWILVVLVALGVAYFLPTLAMPWSLTTVLAVAVYGLQIAALSFLFKSDAAAWLKGESEAGPAPIG